MKFIKKIAALLLIAVMMLSVCGCHKKNEIAVTVGDYEYTSAYYMCALINAFYDGQEEVYNTLTETEQQAEEVDYFSKKIGDKSFSDWVKNRAIEILKTISYYKSVSEKAGVKLDDETKSVSESYASVIWQNYSELFEPNGVSQSTFTDYFVEGAYAPMTDYALAYMVGINTPNDYEELYFQHLYGKDGEKEIKAKVIKKELYDQYIIADVLEVTFTEEQEDSERKNIKQQFKKYEENLKNGKMTFKEVYKDYYQITNKEDLPTSEAKDPFASVLNASSSDNYSDIKKLKTDEVKLFTDDEAGTVSLVVKKDIKSDKYYLETLDNTIRHTLKDEEFQKASEEAALKLKAEVNDYAVDRFKVKNIKTPEY